MSTWADGKKLEAAGILPPLEAERTGLILDAIRRFALDADDSPLRGYVLGITRPADSELAGAEAPWQRAAGAVPRRPGEPRAEERIRKLRGGFDD